MINTKKTFGAQRGIFFILRSLVGTPQRHQRPTLKQVTSFGKAIVMESNLNLHLQGQAVLLFSDAFDPYQRFESNGEGEPSWCIQIPISEKDRQNIAMTGAVKYKSSLGAGATKDMLMIN